MKKANANTKQPTEAVVLASSTPATLGEMVTAIRAHAIEHYSEGGWDVVVESYEDAEIMQLLMDWEAETTTKAIRLMGDHLGVIEDVRQDREAAAKAEGWSTW